MSEEFKPDKNGVLRDKRGCFVPGMSGNPKGGPRTLFPDGKGGMISAGELFRQDVAVVHARLLEIIQDRTTPAGPLVTAINHFLDRALGKPTQAVTVSTDRDTSLDHDLSELSVEQLEAIALIKTRNGDSEVE